MFFPVKYYTAKDLIEIERRISQKGLSSVRIRAKKVEICTWASKQSWREKGKYTKISSHIQAQQPSRGCRLNCQVHAIHECKFFPPLILPAPASVAASHSKRASPLFWAVWLKTRTDFVQRPAAVKFKTAFEFPKVEVGRKQQRFFWSSHRSHPEKKSD